MIHVNNRSYRPRKQAIVGLCLDGCSQAYLDEAAAQMPNLRSIIERGVHGQVNTAIPSFTNPNNVAIITGCATGHKRHSRQFLLRHRRR